MPGSDHHVFSTFVLWHLESSHARAFASCPSSSEGIVSMSARKRAVGSILWPTVDSGSYGCVLDIGSHERAKTDGILQGCSLVHLE